MTAENPAPNSLEPLPTSAILAASLERLLGDANPVSILKRESNDYARTFPSEIVTLRNGDDIEAMLFCKYMTHLPEDHCDYGMRGGVPYEAKVYERVLRSLTVSTPGYVGTDRDARTGVEWLVLRHIAGATDIDRTTEPDMMPKAAAWLGRFHAEASGLAHDPSRAFLKQYDLEFYRGWSLRTLQFSASLRRPIPGLELLCDSFTRVAELLRQELTIIHGEFYPHNILVHDGSVTPVDWESAAIGAGEIDLASLIEGWDEDIAAACIDAYRQARWAREIPESFPARLCAARTYLHLRWLGDQPDWNLIDDAEWHLAGALSQFEKLGFGRAS